MTVRPSPRQSDPIASDNAEKATASFRPLIALASIAGVVLIIGVARQERGFPRYFLGIVGLCLAVMALHRFQKEHNLLARSVTAIATVTHWKKTNGNDGGSAYEVQYQFVAQDGKQYEGTEISAAEFPPVGSKLPVFYSAADPAQNLPVSTLWFYRITHSSLTK